MRKEKCQDVDWVAVVLEMAGRGGPRSFWQRPRDVKLIWKGRKALVLNMQGALFQGPSGMQEMPSTPTLSSSSFPLWPSICPHFP